MTRKVAKEEEQLSNPSYCETCGIDVESNTELKRFGKIFCSQEHMNQYVIARQKSIRIGNIDKTNSDGDYEKPIRRRSRRGCC